MKRGYVATFCTAEGTYSMPYHFTRKREAIRFIHNVGIGNTLKGSCCKVKVIDSEMNEIYASIIYNL